MGKRHDGCNGKRRHKSKLGAIIHLKRIDHADMTLYHCPQCKGWHVGRLRERAVDRIVQLLEADKRRHAGIV